MENDLSGTTLNGYRLTRKIAEGGMGVVYEGVQMNLSRRVAVKILTEHLASESEFLKRFEREAKSAAALNHSNIVQVFDFGFAEGRYYLIMEFVEGENLSEHVLNHGKFSPDAALNIIEHAALALKAAREKSIIHRDIKPSNIMLTSDGRIKVSDLGLAKDLTQDSDVTMTGVGLGSPYFIAPEQAQNARHVDHRADIYGLGLTLLFISTGKRPYDGGSPFATVLAQVNQPLPSGADLGTELPPSLEALIQRMAAKRPEDRHPDYESLLADVQAVRAEMAGSPLQRPKRSKVFPVLPIVAGIVAILLGVVFWPRAKTPPPAAKPATPAPPVSAATMAPQVEPVGQQTMPPPPLADGAQPPEPGGPGQGPPEMGQDGMILPMGPPHRPNFNIVQTGPVDSMLAQVADYAAKHPDDYMSIIAACRQTGQAAAGGPEEQKVDDVTREWEAKYTKISDAAIKTYTAKMQEQLRTGNAQGAYDTWRDFPANLRSREIDMQIRQILQRSLPQDFQAQP